MLPELYDNLLTGALLTLILAQAVILRVLRRRAERRGPAENRTPSGRVRTIVGAALIITLCVDIACLAGVFLLPTVDMRIFLAIIVSMTSAPFILAAFLQGRPSGDST